MTQTATPPPVKPGKEQGPPNRNDQNQQGGQGQQSGQGQPAGQGKDAHGEGVPHDLEMPSTFAIIIAVAAFAVLLVILFLVGFIPTHMEEKQTREEAVQRANALPVVSFTVPTPPKATHDVTLPCDVKANQSVALYTRTNGYLRNFNFDIGQHVEAGQVMAEIDTPEVDAQLKQSEASLSQNEASVIKAQADLDLANVTLKRYKDAQAKSPGSVTQEDVDTRKAAVDDADAALKQAKANVDAAKANVEQLKTQVGFEKIVAPFSGTVTARNYDKGALLSPTNTAAGSEIFDLAQTDPLRVFVNVPQEYANNVKLDQKTKLYVRNFPDKPFEGVIKYTAGAIDPNTRTLSVQINFPNKDGRLFAGEYGEIHLPVNDPESVRLIPTSSLIFNAEAKGLQVAVLQDMQKKTDPGTNKEVQTGKVHMIGIKTGRDFGTTIEVVSGLNNDERVITNPSERTSEGAEVQADRLPGDGVTSSATKPATMPS